MTRNLARRITAAVFAASVAAGLGMAAASGASASSCAPRAHVAGAPACVSSPRTQADAAAPDVHYHA
jgi:hypothetical protein